MEEKRVIASLGLAFFCACAPRADAGKVETLGVGKPAVERRKTTGLSTSLAPEESFARFGTAERDRSFHSDIGFYETVLSYGPIPTQACVESTKTSVAVLRSKFSEYGSSATRTGSLHVPKAGRGWRSGFVDRIAPPTATKRAKRKH